MKRLLVLIALCLSLCLAPVAHAVPAESAPPKVLFFTPSQPGENPFWGDFADFMKAAAENLDIDLKIVYSEHRFSVVDNARKIIEQGDLPDYVIFIYQAKNSLDMLEMLEKAGVDSVICNTDVIEADRNLAGRPREKYRHWIGHIFPDDHMASRVLANRLIERGFELALTDNDGLLHLAGIGGSRDATSGIYRKQGLEEAVKFAPKVVLDRYVWADWERGTARTKTSRLLDMYPDARVFWAVHDGAALGVLDAAEAKGFTPGMNFLTGGIDWSEEGLKAIGDGRMEASVGGHFMDGAWALVMIRDYHNGHDFACPAPTLRSGLRLIDRDNLDTYRPLLDRSNWKRIDFRRFTRTRNPKLREYDFNPDAVLRQLNGK